MSCWQSSLFLVTLLLTLTHASGPLCAEVKTPTSGLHGSSSREPELTSVLLKLPLRFEENRGQESPDVEAFSRTGGLAVLLKKRGTIAFGPLGRRGGNRSLEMTFDGASRRSRLLLENPTTGSTSYFIGRNSRKWIRGSRHYLTTRYQQIYPGVDLLFYGTPHQLEYDLLVAPNVDPDRIRVSFSGWAGPRLDEEGNLRLGDGSGNLVLSKPVAYQVINGQRKPVESAFLLHNSTLRFKLGKYDRNHQLVIDPVLTLEPEISSSSYLGGTSGERVTDMCVGPDGRIYLVGGTQSDDFPSTTHLFHGRGNCFVTILNAAATEILYAVRYGGSWSEGPAGVALGPDGSIYFAGGVGSEDFPTVNAFQTEHGNKNSGIKDGDGFLVRLSPDGSQVIYSTYFGGFRGDGIYDIAVDSAGNAFVTGHTSSWNFPTLKAVQPRCPGCLDDPYGGPGNAFISAFDPSGSLLFSTFFGGTGRDDANEIRLDSEGNVVIAGTTRSPDLPVVAPIQDTLQGGVDGFIAVLSPNWSKIEFATYLGGTAADSIAGLALGPHGEIHIAGTTDSLDFPTERPIQPAIRTPADASYIPTDGFVSKLSADRKELLFSTYFGGVESDSFSSVAVDEFGEVYLSGSSCSTDFPTLRPFDGQGGSFIVKLDTAQPRLLYSSFIGGGGCSTTHAYAMALTLEGEALIAGDTWSRVFPVKNAFQPSGGGQVSDGFIMRIMETKKYLFPQFGAGREGQQAITSDMLLTNVDPERASAVTYQVLADDGRPMTIDVNEVIVRGPTTLEMPPGGTTRLRSGSLNPIQSGSVDLTSERRLATAILFEGSAGMASVSESQPLSEFRVPVEVGSEVNTGLALMNMGGPQTVEFELRDQKGDLVGRSSAALQSRAHLAKFVTELDWSPQIDFTRLDGILFAKGSTHFAAAALRTTSGEYLTLPVSEPGEPSERGFQKRLYFAHFADGAFAGDSVRSQLVLFSETDRECSAVVKLLKGDGSAMTVDLNGITVSGELPVMIPANGSVVLRTDGAGPVQNGWVMVDSEESISGVILYEGSVGSAGFLSSAVMRDFVAPVEVREGVRTGIALAAPAATIMNLELRDAGGRPRAKVSLGLPAGGHVARFLDELEWDTPPIWGGFLGSLWVTAESEVAATMLRTAEGQLATVPVSQRSQRP